MRDEEKSTLVERIVSGEEPANWIFQYPSMLWNDLDFIIQVIWEHSSRRGEFDWDTREKLSLALKDKINV